MEDSKTCGAAQSPSSSNAFPSKASSVVSGQNPRDASRSLPGPLAFVRPHMTMADQHPTMNGTQTHSPDNAWATTTVWEHTPNISESLEGTAGPGADYNGVRSLEWDMKSSPWDWDNMIFSGRGADTHGSKTSFPVGVNSEVGGTLSVSMSKSLSDTRSSSLLEQSRGGSMGDAASVASADHRDSHHSQVASTFDRRRLFWGLGGTSGSEEGRKPHGQEQSNGTGTAVGGGDSLIGLKLGRRTYFEDTGGVRGGGGAVFTASPPGKKQRVQSPGVQAPRCQVEGCKQDLSSAKDYHRRHKVCEMHSKAAKVLCVGLEQRFCQQCSRFHVLTEFDEGKRSCRRRLAGHNERRRKPQPESAAIASSGSSSALHADSGSHATSINDDKRVNGLTERPCFLPLQQRTPGSSSTSVEDSDDHSGSLGTSLKLNQAKGSWPGLGRVDDPTALACQLQVACGERQSYMSTPTADRLLMLLHSPKGQIGGPGSHQFLLEGSGPMGPGLTLSSSAGLSGLEAPASPGVSGLTDSGRALSLLSSHSWGSRGEAPGSVSLDLSKRSDVTLEQLISENSGAPFSPRGQPSHFRASTSAAAEKLFPLQPHSRREMGVTVSSNSNSVVETREQHHRGFLSGLGMVGGYENHTMLALMQGQQPEFRGLQGSTNPTQRPIIDLMQLPSPQSHHSNHNASNGQYSEFPALRPFESALFDSQQML